MSQVADELVDLEDFLQMPETKPACEFIDGRIIQKVSPKAKHSLMQGNLITRINRKTQRKKVGLAFPELRCTFAGRSLVFDVSYFLWKRIPLDEDGEPWCWGDNGNGQLGDGSYQESSVPVRVDLPCK